MTVRLAADERRATEHTADVRAADAAERHVAGDLLLHPIVLLALAVFVINDHVLKPAYGNVATGKLSDITGLIYFPVFAAAIGEVLLSPRWRRELLVGAAVLTGATFVGMLLVSPVGDAYRWFFGYAQWPFRAAAEMMAGNALPGAAPVFLAADPTDLLTLPALLVPLVLANRPTPRA